jgi:hypothetical protein
MAARDPEPPVGFRRTYVDGLPGINSVCGRAGLYFATCSEAYPEVSFTVVSF